MPKHLETLGWPCGRRLKVSGRFFPLFQRAVMKVVNETDSTQPLLFFSIKFTTVSGYKMGRSFPLQGSAELLEVHGKPYAASHAGGVCIMHA